MKTRICFAIWLLVALVARTTAQPLAQESSVKIWRGGQWMQLSINLPQASLQPSPEQIVVVTPWIVGDTCQRAFPSVVVYGERQYRRFERGGSDTFLGEGDIMIREKFCPDSLFYLRQLPYEPWMDGARLRLVRCVADNCDVMETEQELLTQSAARMELIPGRPIVTESVQQRLGRANVTFVVNKTDILPTYRDNQRELARIQASIDSVRLDTAATIRRIDFHSYASPEGPYDNNIRLARGRVESLKQYVTRLMQLPDSLIHTQYTAEDWEGMRRFVREHLETTESKGASGVGRTSGDTGASGVGKASTAKTASANRIPHAKEILALADKLADPDEKLAEIARRYPAEYRYILESCFPALRRTEYAIEYSRREWNSREGETDTIMALPTVPEASPLPDYPTYSRYSPLLALKTNLLFDAVLAFNGELEVPLGSQSRWSIMAEYWQPWFVWHHNSRAYQLQTLGFELRRWTRPRCDLIRPALTGTFWGLYCQTGKYDLEWRSKGYQGEFVSCGLTLGRSWLLSRHWNFEASFSLGAVWGPQRYYEGEFDDTHLIWKHDDRLFYAGPTKLKLSLVYLLPNFLKRKEARR